MHNHSARTNRHRGLEILLEELHIPCILCDGTEINEILAMDVELDCTLLDNSSSCCKLCILEDHLRRVRGAEEDLIRSAGVWKAAHCIRKRAELRGMIANQMLLPQKLGDEGAATRRKGNNALCYAAKGITVGGPGGPTLKFGTPHGLLKREDEVDLGRLRGKSSIGEGLKEELEPVFGELARKLDFNHLRGGAHIWMPLHGAMTHNLACARNGTVESGLEFGAGGLKGSEKGRRGLRGADLCKSGRSGGWIEGGDGGREGIDGDIIGASREEGLCDEPEERIGIRARETGEKGGRVTTCVEVGWRRGCTRRQQLLKSWALCGAEGIENLTHAHRLGHGKWVKRGG